MTYYLGEDNHIKEHKGTISIEYGKTENGRVGWIASCSSSFSYPEALGLIEILKQEVTEIYEHDD